MTPFLTIGMAAYDDYDGVYFSTQAIRLYHPEVASQIEIIVLDNNPKSKHGECTAHLSKESGNAIQYRKFVDYASTAVRNKLFEIARGQFVLCIDCHVLLQPGSLATLIDYLKNRPDSPHLYHGPMYHDNLEPLGAATHMAPVWREQMFGIWQYAGHKLRENEPFEIPMHGMGLFCCRRSAWPGFNPAFRGFGGEEGYIHEKFRQRGAKVICLPFLRWLHRFDRPARLTYPITVEHKARNYFIGWNELGLPDQPITEHFSHYLPETVLRKLRLEALALLGQKKSSSPNSIVPPHPTHHASNLSHAHLQPVSAHRLEDKRGR